MIESGTTLGLTTSQAKALLASVGPNEVVPGAISGFLSELKKIFTDPMSLMLLILGGLYWALGDKTDALVLFGAFIPVSAVDVILEIRSAKALESLRATLAPTAKVFRDGSLVDLPVREIVPNDVLAFFEGQTLPADGRVLEADILRINEAALTGESMPVDKDKGDPFYGGTTALSGRGLGLVEKTGRLSKYGQIAGFLSSIEGVKSPLRKKVDQLVRYVFAAAILMSLILFVMNWIKSREWIPSLIVALTLGMAAVPEEFPLVYTLYLSLGAWRLSKFGILVKSLPSVETLGGVDVICTDKTGTLTEGRFQLEELKRLDPDFPESEAWKCALMACEIHAVDSLEVAIFEKGRAFADSLRDWILEYDYPFETLGKHMSHVWKNTVTGQRFIAMKGAVEGVLEHVSFDPESRTRIEETLGRLAGTGRRILGLAGRELKGDRSGDRIADEKDLKFIGFLVFSDPIRTSVKEAIVRCQTEGIEVKMLTGDHLLTAHAVADQIGLTHGHDFLYSGQALSQMSPDERAVAYRRGALFARVLPEQKYEMVRALQAAGKIVAMTGDGINDAPALKLADIGISMGESATDVARATAKMVLLKNDFSGIVQAVLEGRRIFSNLRRSFSYLISFHIPVILLAMIPPFLGWPPLLMPVHIILLELIVHPVSAFTFEGIRGEHLAKNPKTGLLRPAQWVEAALPGFLVSAGALWLYGAGFGASADVARGLAFETVLFGNAFFVLAGAAPRFGARVFMTIALLLGLIAAVAAVPELNLFLHFHSLRPSLLTLPFLIGALAGISSVAAFRSYREIERRPERRRSKVPTLPILP